MKWLTSMQHSCTAPDTRRPAARPLSCLAVLAARPARCLAALAARPAARPARCLAVLAACFVLGGFAAELFLSSCIRRPLEVYYFDKARLILHVDWMSHFGQRPNGMTVCIYDEGGQLYESRSMNEIDSVQLQLPVGRYRVIVFNEDIDAFTSFGFQDIGTFDAFRTVAKANNSRRMTPTSWDYGTRYTWEPDELLGAAVDSFEVTQQMLDSQEPNFTSYHNRNRVDDWRKNDIYHIYDTIMPLQTMLHMRIHVNGMENMYHMEVNLSGMAAGGSLAHTWRTPTETTVFYDSDRWSYYFDGDASKHGWVYIDIPTWGEPHGQELQETRDSTQNPLRMYFTLRDKEHTEKFFLFNTGHLIEYHEPQANPAMLTPPDVLRHLYLEINREIPLLPDVPQDEEMGAGFNAHVDPWEYGGEFDLGTF